MIVLAILPVGAFFLLWFLLVAFHPVEDIQQFPWGEKIIKTGLFWSAFLVFGTELLSLFNLLTTMGVVLFWTFAVIVLSFVHWQRKTFKIGLVRVKGFFKGLTLDYFDWVVLIIVIVTLGILLITGLMSPPNIHDVMTYHMSRIMYWIQNRSLTFFPTSIIWQIWMPPFSELAQLNWQLLAGSDVLSSIHNWYSLVLTMVAVSAIAEKVGVQKRGQWLSALFVLSLPIIVLQASGAKNDIVLAFFFASLAFYVVKASDHSLTFLDWVCAGLAVGLGVLTKGNFPFFALPLLIWLFIVMLKKVGWKRTLAFAALGMLLVTALNGGHWIRNTQTFGGPFTTGDASVFLNNRFGADVLVSNFSRNVAVQILGVGFINRFIQDSLTHIHNWMGIPLFDQAITLGPPEFYYVPTREEVASNPFHFGVSALVFLLAFITAIKKSDDNRVWLPRLLAIAAVAGLIIFSGFFRWQVWGTRFLIPYYVLFAPVVGFVFDRQLPYWASWLMVLLMTVLLLNPLVNNYSRSFSWSEENRNSIWRMSRKGLRFANHQVYEGAILELTYLMDLSGCRIYGLEIGSNAPEYLIWGTLTPSAQAYYLEHIAVDNHSAIHATENFDPCGIVVFEVPLDEMVLKDSYIMVEQWRVEPDGGFPLSLYMKPEFIPQPVE